MVSKNVIFKKIQVITQVFKKKLKSLNKFLKKQ